MIMSTPAMRRAALKLRLFGMTKSVSTGNNIEKDSATNKTSNLITNNDKAGNKTINTAPKGLKNAVIRKAAIGATVGVAVAAAVPLTLRTVGFSSNVEPGSIAAGIMSVFGTSPGGIVSYMQSIGAAGLSPTTYVAAAGIGSTLAIIRRRIMRKTTKLNKATGGIGTARKKR